MTSTNLQALRRLLFFSVPEAAQWVAASRDRPQGVSERAWRFWEDGRRPIPADIQARIHALAQWRADALDTAAASISAARTKFGEHNEAAPPVLVWYERIEEWLPRDPALWRPQCSVIADLVARYHAVIVPFDAADYKRWRGGRPDSETLRGEWAAQRADELDA